MNEVLLRQMAVDYCCGMDDVADERNHFTQFDFREGRRRFREEPVCFLKLAVINGKILFTGKSDIVQWCEDTYKDTDGAWFLEAKNLKKINDRIIRDGYRIGQVHPFYIPSCMPERVSWNNTDQYDIRWYRGKEIEQFRGDGRFSNAYTFYEDAPDVIGVSAGQDGKILGMAGASADSPTMWQIGIDVDRSSRRTGIGKMLVSLLKNEILGQGILPYYGTAFSHIASQKVALGAGFIPAWAELVTEKIADRQT